MRKPRFRPTTDLNFGGLVMAYATERGKPTENVDQREDAREDVQALLDVLGRTVAAGHSVKLNNFGSFERGTHKIAAGALGGRVTRTTTVKTIRFRASGKLLAAVRSGRRVTTLRRDAKTVPAPRTDADA